VTGFLCFYFSRLGTRVEGVANARCARRRERGRCDVRGSTDWEENADVEIELWSMLRATQRWTPTKTRLARTAMP
jgi:hypothetical protein